MSIVEVNNKDNFNNVKENGCFSYIPEEYSTGNNSKNKINGICFVIHDIKSNDNSPSFLLTNKKLKNRQKI